MSSEREVLVAMKSDLAIALTRLSFYLNGVGPHPELETIGKLVHTALNGPMGIKARLENLPPLITMDTWPKRKN